MIQIITDSTTDIPKEKLQGYQLPVLPLTITVDGKNYLDGVNLTITQVYAWMRDDILPSTSQIPYEQMQQTFVKTCEEEKDFIYLSFSSKMSGCFSLAHMMIEELKETYPMRKMLALDSCGGSAATGLIVLQALKMAEMDCSFEEIVKELQFMIAHVEHIFSVADLRWMVKGGRISKPAGLLGSTLNLLPWLDVEDGKMVVKGITRGAKKMMNLVAGEVAKRAEAFPDQLIAITHADDEDAAKTMEELIKAKLPMCRTMICEIGGVLGVHLGRGGVGVFFFNQKSANYLL